MFNEIIIFIQGGIYIQRNNYFDATNYLYICSTFQKFSLRSLKSKVQGNKPCAGILNLVSRII